MKKLLLAATIITGIGTTAQGVGINTTKPNGIFHVDGAKDNGTSGSPSIAQQANDFLITAAGSIGIGTIYPSAQLHTTGTVRFQNYPSQVLATDANGYLTNFSPINIYNSNGTLSGNRYVGLANHTLRFTNDAESIIINGNSGIAAVMASGTNRGLLRATSDGGSFVDMYVDNSAAAQLCSGGTASSLLIGTSTGSATPLHLMTNGIITMTILNGGNVGIGTNNPQSKVEIDAGLPGQSGLRFSKLTAGSTTGTGQALGVDAAGNVITLATPSAPSLTTQQSSASSGTSFSVTDNAYNLVPGTTKAVNIPVGGKQLFINYMLGLNYSPTPTGGGTARYQVTLFIDNVMSDVFIISQENGSDAQQGQFTLSTVQSLTTGSHTIDIRIKRLLTNGATQTLAPQCSPLSMSFNASYLN